MGDALHGIILWRKASIKLIRNRAAPMDPRSPPDAVNDDRVPSLQPPTPPSPPRRKARSTPTPPGPEKGKKKTASSLPAAGPSKKKQKTVERKLTYEKTAEELEEETARYINARAIF